MRNHQYSNNCGAERILEYRNKGVPERNKIYFETISESKVNITDVVVRLKEEVVAAVLWLYNTCEIFVIGSRLKSSVYPI